MMRRQAARRGSRQTAATGIETMKTKAGRKKGNGTLERHGKIWRACWIVDGKRFRRSTGTADKREAEKLLAQWTAPFQLKNSAEKDSAMADKAADLAAVSDALRSSAKSKREAFRKATALPLADAWRAFDDSLFHREWAQTTHDLNETRVESFLAWMRKRHPEIGTAREVTTEHASGFMQEIRKAHSGKTFNDYRAILLQTWDGLRKIDVAAVTENPFRFIERAERRSHTRRELTVEELAAVIAATEGEMRLLFAVGIYTGLRLGDAVRLDWGDVDLVRGFVSVVPSKTARHETRVKIPLSPVLRALLEETPARRRRGPVFDALRARYEESTGGMNLVRDVQRVFRKAGIATQSDAAQRNKDGTPRKAVDVGFHSLRHTYVSLCANAGVPLAVVQSIVGHTSPAMTRHYFHESDDALRGAAAALPDVVGAGAAPALPAPVSGGEDATDDSKFTQGFRKGTGDAECAKSDTTRAREAVAAFKRACAGLAAAGLSPADWREVAAALADVEAKRRA